MGDGGLYAMVSRLRLQRFPLQAGLESGTARSASHRLAELLGSSLGRRKTARYRLKYCPNNLPYVPVLETESPSVNP